MEVVVAAAEVSEADEAVAGVISTTIRVNGTITKAIITREVITNRVSGTTIKAIRDNGKTTREDNGTRGTKDSGIRATIRDSGITVRIRAGVTIRVVVDIIKVVATTINKETGEIIRVVTKGAVTIRAATTRAVEAVAGAVTIDIPHIENQTTQIETRESEVESETGFPRL